MKYVYNSKTLRYEPSRISVLNVISITIGLLVFSGTFFVLLVYLQNYLIETPLERSLRSENKALSYYKVELSSHLEVARNRIQQLESKDKTLYEKIFDTRKVSPALSTESGKEILLADVPAFHEITASLLQKFTNIYSRAQLRNYYFSEKSSVDKTDIQFLMAMPTFAPVAEFDAVKVVSGFGTRINPFHKRNYHHDGIDLAGPRGSEVLSAAAGRVITTSYSDLQAGFGNYIEVDHGNGYVTRYANLGSITVAWGQKVKKGQSIGTIGISGGSVAPHVHYEVMRHGVNLDPVKFLVHGLSSNQYDQVWHAATKQNQSLD